MAAGTDQELAKEKEIEMRDHGFAHGGDGEHRVDGHTVVLDIGGTIGALVIYTDADQAGSEIELLRARCGAGVHSQVHPRVVGDGVLFAAVYPELEAGDYEVVTDLVHGPLSISVTGGEVALMDWRRGSDG